MYQLRYQPSDGRHYLIDQLSADISVDIAAETWPIRWPFIVGRISVDRRWYIGQKLRLLVYKLYAFHPFFGQPQKFLKASCSAFMCRKFSCYQARHSIEILPNTQNTVDRIEDKDDEGWQGAGIELMKDKPDYIQRSLWEAGSRSKISALQKLLTYKLNDVYSHQYTSNSEVSAKCR